MQRLLCKIIGIFIAVALSSGLLWKGDAAAQSSAPEAQTAPARKFPVSIDARRLFYPFFIIPGVTPQFRDARSVQTVDLAPGAYSYQVQSGEFANFTFTVTPDGTVDYERKFDAFLGGRGSKNFWT